VCGSCSGDEARLSKRCVQTVELGHEALGGLEALVHKVTTKDAAAEADSRAGQRGLQGVEAERKGRGKG